MDVGLHSVIGTAELLETSAALFPQVLYCTVRMSQVISMSQDVQAVSQLRELSKEFSREIETREVTESDYQAFNIRCQVGGERGEVCL
jgi:hypothetical protein